MPRDTNPRPSACRTVAHTVLGKLVSQLREGSRPVEADDEAGADAPERYGIQHASAWPTCVAQTMALLGSLGCGDDASKGKSAACG